MRRIEPEVKLTKWIQTEADVLIRHILLLPLVHIVEDKMKPYVYPCYNTSNPSVVYHPLSICLMVP